MRFSLSDRSPSVCFEDLVHCTFQALARVPDFRKARGRQLDLSGILALIVVVGLAFGHHSLAARPTARAVVGAGKHYVFKLKGAISPTSSSPTRCARGTKTTPTRPPSSHPHPLGAARKGGPWPRPSEKFHLPIR
jgi:hypothetical protein